MGYINKWDMLYEDFKMMYPELEKHTIDWYPSGPTEITMMQDDRSKVTYDSYFNAIRFISRENCTTDISEEDWRNNFGIKLSDRLIVVGMTQKDLSERTGISAQTISKYIRGCSSPSTYNIIKIAKALNCSTTSLLYFDVGTE